MDARHVVQGHSHVPDMWQRVTQPDLLIYLDASLEVIRQRRRVSKRRLGSSRRSAIASVTRQNSAICMSKQML